jgi:hypothetical protein
MPHPVQPPKSWVKSVGLFVWLVGLAVIIYFAYCCKDHYSLRTSIFSETASSPTALNLRELLYIAAPIFTFVFTVIMHLADRHLFGGGIAQRGRETPELHKLEPDVISGTMTKLSVLAALASILIVFVQQVPNTQDDYYLVVRLISSTGFLTSIFLMLISVKTYDYTNRFNWEKHPHQQGARGDSYYRVKLAEKAFRLDVASFYCLIFTAILSTGLIVRWFPIAGSLLCGLLLWLSYFFRKRDLFATLQPYSITLAALDPPAVESWYREKLSFTSVNASNLLTLNEFFLETEQVEAALINPITRLSFRLQDLESVARQLKEKGVEVITDVRTNENLKIKEFIVKDPTGTVLRFIQELK